MEEENLELAIRDIVEELKTLNLILKDIRELLFDNKY